MFVVKHWLASTITTAAVFVAVVGYGCSGTQALEKGTNVVNAYQGAKVRRQAAKAMDDVDYDPEKDK
jgi:hypothetical protein